eukprot:4648071-Lingulodinium_polyedra.AAC.1
MATVAKHWRGHIGGLYNVAIEWFNTFERVGHARRLKLTDGVDGCEGLGARGVDGGTTSSEG